MKHIDVILRLMQKICIQPNGCWLWKGSTSSRGYGQINDRGRLFLVHRLAYETFSGPIPRDKELDHLCRIHSCLNPDHLEVVTHRENILRGNAPSVVRALWAAKTECPRHHPYNTENTYWQRSGNYLGRTCRTCHNEREKRRYHEK